MKIRFAESYEIVAKLPCFLVSKREVVFLGQLVAQFY